MRNYLRSEIGPWAALTACLCLLFYRGLVLSEIPAFRDGFHFYYPQAVWLDRRATRGELFPTWNPEEGLGASVAGQPSSALYYPLRCLWWLSGFSLPQRYAIVCVVHLLIAAGGMRYAARGLRLPRAAGWLAAFSYALSCPVLFQHSNLIYLCSAAWLGFALGAIARVCWRPDQELYRSCWVFAAATALMTLGGDPQASVNSLLFAGVAVIVRGIAGWHSYRTSRTAEKSPCSWPGLTSLSWLACATALVICLTTIQWLPAARWTSHSSRLAGQATPALVGVSNPLIEPALREAPEKPHRKYDFSLGPWYLATCIWPTLGGHYMPENSRLFDALPSEGRMWIPSIYFGLLPCWLILTTLWTQWASHSQTGRSQTRPLILLIGFALLAALGNYSVVWLLRESFSGLGWDAWARQLPRDHVGSVSWLLAEVVPGYGAFRYPAKWTVWFSAAACLLAAHSMSVGVHRWGSDPRTRNWTQRLWGMSTVGLTASISFWLLSSFDYLQGLDVLLAQHASDPLLGAPSTEAISKSAMLAFAIPSLLLWIIARIDCSMPTIAMLTLAEMTCVAMPWVCFAPPPAPLAAPAPLARNDVPLVWAKSLPDSQLPFSTLGKLGLLSSVRWFNTTQSIEPVSVERLKHWLATHDQLSTTAPHPQLEPVLAELGITHRLVQTASKDGTSSVEWRVVPNPKPFCELLEIFPVESAPAESVTSSVEWQWLNSTTLLVHATCTTESQLIVRQLNDGGWSIDSGEENSIQPPRENALFIHIALPPGEHFMRFQRKWWW